MSGADAPSLRLKINEFIQNGTSVDANLKEPNLNEKLQKLINQAPVTLFMKGTPQEPRCGKTSINDN